jgi:hypothetical protein
MHLAWAFFGYSYSYNVFMGIAECAGLLLLFRRTTSIGALLTMAALANIIVVNYSFDVHAKIYPTALFFMALFLLSRDAKRIIRFFFTGRAIALPAIKAPVFQKQWMQVSKPALKFLVMGYFLTSHLLDTMGYKRDAEERLNAISQYSGIYDIESFVANGETLSDENPLRWQKLIIGDNMLEAVRLKGDRIAFVSVAVDEKRLLVYSDQDGLYSNMQEIYNELGPPDDTYNKIDSILVARHMVSSLDFELSDSSTLILKGNLNNDTVYITAKRSRIDKNDFRLMKRRFHWINEASYFY